MTDSYNLREPDIIIVLEFYEDGGIFGMAPGEQARKMNPELCLFPVFQSRACGWDLWDMTGC